MVGVEGVPGPAHVYEALIDFQHSGDISGVMLILWPLPHLL